MARLLFTCQYYRKQKCTWSSLKDLEDVIFSIKVKSFCNVYCGLATCSEDLVTTSFGPRVVRI